MTRPDSALPPSGPSAVTPSPQATLDRPHTSAALAATSGIVAAMAALGLGELLAGLFTGLPSPVSAVGSALIDLAPAGSKEVVVSLFGTGDKVALTVLVTLAVLAIGAGVGLLSRRRLGFAEAVIVAVAGVGLVAAMRQPGTSLPLLLLLAFVQALGGTWVLSALVAAAGGATTAGGPPMDATGAAVPASAPEPAGRAPLPGAATSRRGFLLRAGTLGALSVIGGGLGRQMLEGRAGQASAAAAVIPQASDPAVTPGPDGSLAVAGITPLVVPNDRFYRIDTALITPAIDVAKWQLRVHGMVRKEVTLSFAQLVELPLIERYVTIACVSNEVGGDLVGNAKWTGVRLTDVLDMAGVQPGATQVVPRSVDGWTAGFPTAWITDPAHPRDAMIAVKMNDVPLPAEHGFPARLIVPGLYGYVSATKWLTELELTTLEAFDAYWVPRGWAKEAPILTQARIDVPRNSASVNAGPVTVAGVAWAPDRGIAKVEISVDGGAWQAATLGMELGPQTWVQWKWTWQAPTGSHVLEVRATDGTGEVQTTQRTRPDPDGARGHHRVSVQVA